MNRVALAAVLPLLILFGCADSHQLVRQGSDANPKLTPTDSIYVAMPRDGVYGNDTYQGSGATTVQVLVAAFAKHARSVEAASSYQTYEQALSTARAKGFKYLVFPTILHWEDRATEWSGIPDKVEVKVQVVEAASDAVIDSGIVKGKSGWATLGGDHPQDLLPKPIQEFVSALY